jgi:hypothetical protein
VRVSARYDVPVPARPALPDVLRLGRAIKRGSVIDEPISVLSVVREFVSGDTPEDSPLTLKMLLRRDDYRDLSTAKLAAGDPAFDFELPRHDFSEGTAVATGETVRLSSFRSSKPVALIFGSYT